MARAGGGWIILLGALLLLSGARTPSSSLPDLGPGVWYWPLPTLYGTIRPHVTSGFGVQRQNPTPHTHAGVDVMYPRAEDLARNTRLPVADHGSIGSFLPEWAQVLAARAGTVSDVATTSRGTHVLVDHGNGVVTFYQHLTGVYIAEGDRVLAGQPIGTPGWDPTSSDEIRHLHFEIRHNGVAIDPKPAMGSWLYMAG